MEIARRLLERGMDVDAGAAVDAAGFGGHTALFATVVSQPNFWMNYGGKPQVAPFTELLLDHRWKGAPTRTRIPPCASNFIPDMGPNMGTTRCMSIVTSRRCPGARGSTARSS